MDTKRIGSCLLNLLLPLRCIKCGDVLNGEEGLCSSCWPLIPFISAPFCACCGVPFDFTIEEGAFCLSCTHARPFYKTARSVFCYTADSRELILRFKHLDHISSTPLFARWMSLLSEEKEETLCVPVPLHWTRLLMRTYNQAALLAQEISRLKRWAYTPTLLERSRKTVSQGNLKKKARIKNVCAAFKVKEQKKDRLVNRTVVLIDDVLTTGATLNACSETLLQAGAKEIHALTLGRVVKPEIFFSSKNIEKKSHREAFLRTEGLSIKERTGI